MAKRVWAFLVNLFLIPKLDRRARETGRWIFRFLRFFAWMALGVYLIGIPLSTVGMLASSEFIGLILLPVNVVLFPLMVKAVILMNLSMHGQRLK